MLIFKERFIEGVKVALSHPVTIPASAYFINSLGGQSRGRGRGGPTYF